MDRTIKEGIVLAGGLGTRLRSEIGDYPKPLALINDRPFLSYLLDYLIAQSVSKVVLSVGYKWEMIRDKYGYNYNGLEILYAIEEKPLGTGGGIRLAMEQLSTDHFFVLNGDTYFDISLTDLASFYLDHRADCALALKELHNVDRYGCVSVNSEHRITGFEEKAFREKTIINGGIYCLNKAVLHDFPIGQNFSFETDFLEKKTGEKRICGKIYTDYFIDIGIPEDYKQFARDMAK